MRKNSSSLLILALLAATTLIITGCHHPGWGHSAGFYYGTSTPSGYYTPGTHYSTHYSTTALIHTGQTTHRSAPHKGHVVKPAPKPNKHQVPGPKPGHGGNIHAKPDKHPGNSQTTLHRPGNQTPPVKPLAHMEQPSGSRPPAKPSENLTGGRTQPSFSPGKHRNSPGNPAVGKRGEKTRT